MEEKFTARDRGHVEEIKKALEQLGKVYGLNMSAEIKWLYGLNRRFGDGETLRGIIEEFGEEWSEDREDDFDMSGAKKFVDFYNNGGLEFHGSVNYALMYAAVYDGGRVEIGAWAWMPGEDFDDDATFEVYDEDDFSGDEIDRIIKKIKEIYEQIR